MGFHTRLQCLAVGLGFCVIMSLPGCRTISTGSGEEVNILRRGHGIFQDQTCRRTDAYEVTSTDMSKELCIRIGLKSGLLAWQILGPDGQSAQGSGDATSDGAYHVNYCMDVVPGDWQFVLDMEQASGEYEIAWYQPGSAPSVVTKLPKTGD